MTENELVELNNLVFNDREKTAIRLKRQLQLQCSSRTVQKYLNILGWRKIRTKFCQFVSFKNRIDRFIFAKLSLACIETFDFNIFIDESTVQCDKNANKQWYQDFPGETRIGLIGKYSHELSLHVLGGISRRGPTQLALFTGKLDQNSFQDLCDQFLVP